jgi:hypothetical protein
MAKKLFLNRQRAILTTEVPSVKAGWTEWEAGLSERSSMVSGTSGELPFKILDETAKFLQNLIGHSF